MGLVLADLKRGAFRLKRGKVTAPCRSISFACAGRRAVMSPLFKMRTRKTRKPKSHPHTVHKHHTVPLNTVGLIDWHLRHLWCCGWTTTQDLSPSQHRRLHREDRLKVTHDGVTRSFIQSRFAALTDSSHVPGMVPGTTVPLTRESCGSIHVRVAGPVHGFKGTGTA